MSHQAKLTPELRKSLFQKNQAAFKKYNPHLHQILANHRPSSRLVFDDDGLPDVIIDGKPLFDGRAADHAAEQFEAFLQHPTHIAVSAMQPGQFDRYGNPLMKNVLDRAKDEGIGFGEGLPSGGSFFLLVFGVGLGLHIDAVVEAVDPYIIQFIEPNLDNLYHSLQVYPWHSLLKRQADRNGAVYITLDNHPERVLELIQGVIREHCPPALDGTPCFVCSDPENAKIAIDGLGRNAGMILSNLGFLYDQTLMLKNTYMNLSSGSANVFVRAKYPEITTPVFVVGAGASLDHDLDFIRENADKVIIISTGTALRSLLVNGITPDFHVEMENVHVYSSINQLAGDYDLSSICLTTATTIEHHIIKFFDNIVYFFRSGLSPYPLFCRSDANSLRVPGPLVINASFSLALDIGAKNIYLFGTDFGSRGEGLDHAKDNVLYTNDAVIGYVREFGIPVPANFEGPFYASDDFVDGLRQVRGTILFHGGDRRFFNCSDGARIEGATPVRSRDLRLKGSAKRKQRDKRSIRNSHTVMTDEWFKECWDEDRLRAGINAFADGAVTILGDADAFQDRGYLARYMVLTGRAPKLGNSPPEPQRSDTAGAVSLMFQGSLDKILIGLRYYLGRVRDPGKEPRFREIVAEEFSTSIEDMRRDALAMIDDPTDILPAKADGEWKDEDFIQEAYYTWGNTPRNAPCPCGSGKRYKRCHG